MNAMAPTPLNTLSTCTHTHSLSFSFSLSLVCNSYRKLGKMMLRNYFTTDHMLPLNTFISFSFINTVATTTQLRDLCRCCLPP